MPILQRLALALIVAAAAFDPAPVLAEKAYIPDAENNLVSILDTATRTVTGSLTLDGGPPVFPSAMAITADGATAFVAEPISNSVVAVTLATGAVSATIPVGQTPIAIAVTPDGSAAYVANFDDGTVSVIENSSLQPVATLAVGQGPIALAFTPDGSKAVVANRMGNSVSVIDVASGTVSAPIAVSAEPSSVAVTPDGKKAFVSTSIGGVSVVDVATLSVANIPMTSNPGAVATGADRARARPISRPARAGSAATPPACDGCTVVVVTPDGREAFVVGEDAVAVIDVSTMAVTQDVSLPFITVAAAAITPDSRQLLIPTIDLGFPVGAPKNILVFDTTTFSLLGEIPVGPDPTALAVTADGSRAIVLDGNETTLTVASVPGRSVLGTVKAGPGLVQPTGVAASPDGSKVYVADALGARVFVIRTATDTVSSVFGVGAGPGFVAFTPDGRKAYVVNQVGGTVSAVDGTHDVVTGTIAIANPDWVAVTPDGSKAYVTDARDGIVSILRTATDTVTGTLSIPGAGMMSVAPDGRAYVLSTVAAGSGRGTFLSESIIPVDTAADTVSSGIPVGTFFSSDGEFAPETIVLAPDGNTAYAPVDIGYVTVDLRTGTVTPHLKSVLTGAIPSITPDGSQIYFLLGASSFSGEPPSGTVEILDTQAATVSFLPVGTAPSGFGTLFTPNSSPLAAAVLPGARSVQTGSTAAVFATLLNSGATALDNCAIGLDASAPAGLTMSYQTTDPTTNALTGTLDTPVALAAGGAQSFALFFQSGAAFADPGQVLTFECAGAPPAPIVTGVDTVDLAFSTGPTQDIIALVATAPQPGVATIPFSTGGATAFAVATINVGIAGTLTVSADTGSAQLPVTAALCPTDPATAACLQPPVAAFQQSFAANATPTFSVFLTASGAIPFAPGTSRVFVRFTDANGVSHGSTSVAVDTD
jgi:YVTN family beta-propeller protein